MPTRAAWETQYALAYRADTFANIITATETAGAPKTSGLLSSTSTNGSGGNKGIGRYSQADTDGAGTITTVASQCGLLLDEKPSIDPGVEVVTTEKTTGLSQAKTGSSGMGIELALTRKAPKLSIGSMGLTPQKLEVFAWLLLQKGALTETGSNSGAPEVTAYGTNSYTKTFLPYVLGQPEPEVYCDIGTHGGAVAVNTGQIMTAAICTQLALKGNQGERMVLSAELMGRNYASNYVHTATEFTPESTADRSFLDFTWTFGGTAANLQSVEVTIANNAKAAYYNSLIPTGYTLGRSAVTGSVSLAMSTTTVGDYTQVDNFVAGTDIKIEGISDITSSPVNSNYIALYSNARYTGATVDPAEIELLLTLPFEGVYDGTNHSISIITKSVNRLVIP